MVFPCPAGRVEVRVQAKRGNEESPPGSRASEGAGHAGKAR